MEKKVIAILCDVLINSVENDFNLLPLEQYFFSLFSLRALCSAVFMTQRCQWTYFVVKNTWLHLSHFAREKEEEEEEEEERRRSDVQLCRLVTGGRQVQEQETRQT